MADSKLTGLTANTSPALTDLTYLVDDPGGSPLSQKITVADLLAVASPTFTTPTVTTSLTVTRNSVGVTSADGLVLQNTTDAAAGAQQYSPRLRWHGEGWKTNATAASQEVDWIAQLVPVQGAVSPTTKLQFSNSINGGAYSVVMNLTELGQIELIQPGSSNNRFIMGGSANAIFGYTSNGVGYTYRFIGDYNGTNGYAELCFGSLGQIHWQSTTRADAGVVDLYLERDAAGILAVRNSTTAQTFRVYETYTDASNYERASLSCASNTVTLAAETAGTGSDDMDVAFTPAGAGLVKFGTHSALAAETVSGYITIKDSGGTSRKIAVVS